MSNTDILTESVYQVEALQQECLDLSIASMATNSIDLIIEYNHYLYALMEKQDILYSRLKLMNDETYQGLVDAIEQYTTAMGRREDQTVAEFHNQVKGEALNDLSQLTGEPIDPENIELDVHWED